MSFSVGLNDLKNLISLYQNGRDSREEVRIVQEQGGSKYFLNGLTSHLKKGIRKASIETRTQVFGSNHIQQRKPAFFYRLLFEAFYNWITILMILVCITTLSIDFTTANLNSKHTTSWVQSLAILIAIIISCFTNAINDYYKEIEFNKLDNFELQRKRAAVIRENDTVEVPLESLVVGDVLMITQGMTVPVDAWLVEGFNIVVDESHIIQNHKRVRKQTVEKIETLSVPDNVVSPVLINGTKLLAGEGKAIVALIGSDLTPIPPAEKGQEQTTTPLKENLEKLTYNISVFGIVSSITILVAFAIRFIIYKVTQEPWTLDDLQTIFRFVLLSTTIIMVSVPEGLPLSVSLSLGHSLKKMLEDNNLVRDLKAYEKMGEVSMICTGKSGLVTQNKMDVVMWWNEETFDVGQDLQMPIRTSLHQNYKQLFLINLFVNSTADIKNKNYGSPTEVGLMRFGERFNEAYGDYRMNYHVHQKLSFNSIRKRTTIVVEYQGESYMFTKGAGEILLEHCTHYHSRHEKTSRQLEKGDLKNLESQIKEFTQRGLRVILLAYKKLENQSIQDGQLQNIHPLEESNLTLQALVGISDPSRDESKQYVKSCHSAGIDVKMITGQNLTAAISLAKQVGIIQPNRPSLCLDGEEFEIMVGGLICEKCRTHKCLCQEQGLERKNIIKNIEDFDRIVRRLDVLARVRPSDKQILMTGLGNKGIVVAATCRQRSDLAAMKHVDVSFATGLYGTDTTRQTSSVILINDNFNSIIKSVLWGRNIYDALRKFIQFQLTVNAVAVVFTVVGVIFIDQQPLSPIQLIWVNMIMDTFASLALSTEQPSPTLLERRPNNKVEPIINTKMWKHIVSQAVFQIFILIGLLFFGEHFIPEYSDPLDSLIDGDLTLKYNNGNGKTVISGRLHKFLSTRPDYLIAYQKLGLPSRHLTFIFNTFVFFQLFNFFNCRKLYDQSNVFSGVFSNPLFCIVVGGTTVLQVLIICFGSKAFEVYPFYGLKPMHWVMSIGIAASSLVLCFLVKMLPQSEDQEDFLDAERKKKINRSGKLALRSKEFDSDDEDSINNL